MAIVGIILNTVRETLRQPFFFLLLAGGVAAILVVLWLPLFTFQNDTDMYKELGLSFILLFSLLIGLLAAATGIAREVEEKTAHMILAKSLRRGTYILGKYLGVMAVVGLAVGVLGLVFMAAVHHRVKLDAGVLERVYTMGGIGRQIEAFRARQLNQALTVAPGIVLVYLQVGVLAAVATALSTRLSAAASVGFSLAAYLVGHLAGFLWEGVRASGAAAQAAALAVMAVLPQLELFTIHSRLAHTMLRPLDPGTPGHAAWLEVWGYVGWASLYAAAYAAVAIGAAVVLFRRRGLA